MKPQNASLAVSVKGPQVPRTVLVAPPSRFAKRIEASAETRRPVAMRFMESSLGGEGTPLSTGSQGSRLPASSRLRHSGRGERPSIQTWQGVGMARRGSAASDARARPVGGDSGISAADEGRAGGAVRKGGDVGTSGSRRGGLRGSFPSGRGRASDSPEESDDREGGQGGCAPAGYRCGANDNA